MAEKLQGKHLSEEDMRQVLDLAFKKQLEGQKHEKSGLDFAHIRDAAIEMGIAEEDLNRALNAFYYQKKQRKKLLFYSGSALGLIALLVFLIWWYNRPVSFDGQYKAVFAHKLSKNNRPVREAARFALNQKKVIFHLRWLEMDTGNYDITYKWFGPKGELIYVNRYTLNAQRLPYNSWCTYQPQADDPTGEWRVQVKLGRMRIGNFSFKMEKSLPAHVLALQASRPYKGEAQVQFISKLKGNNPSDKVQQIRVGEKVIAYVKLLAISGSHLATWRWVHQDKKTASVDSVRFTVSRGEKAGANETKTWSTWDPYLPKKPGDYYVYFFLDEYFVSKNKIVVTP